MKPKMRNQLVSLSSMALLVLVMPPLPGTLAPGSTLPSSSPIEIINPMEKHPLVNSWQIHQKAGETAFMANNLDKALRDLKVALLLAANHEQRIQTLVALDSVYEDMRDLSNELKTLLQLTEEISTDKERIRLLADTYAKLGYLETAAGGTRSEEYYQRSLSIYKKASATKSLEYASSLWNLAELAQRRHDLDTAADLLVKTANTYDACLGTKNVSSSIIYSQLGDLGMQLGQPKTASRYYFKAWQGFNSIFGPTDPTTKSLRQKYYDSAERK